MGFDLIWLNYMAKFAIRITETLARTVIVDSDDLDEAIQKVGDAVSEDKIIGMCLIGSILIKKPTA